MSPFLASAAAARATPHINSDARSEIFPRHFWRCLRSCILQARRIRRAWPSCDPVQLVTLRSVTRPARSQFPFSLFPVVIRVGGAPHSHVITPPGGVSLSPCLAAVRVVPFPRLFPLLQIFSGALLAIPLEIPLRPPRVKFILRADLHAPRAILPKRHICTFSLWFIQP